MEKYLDSYIYSLCSSLMEPAPLRIGLSHRTGTDIFTQLTDCIVLSDYHRFCKLLNKVHYKENQQRLYTYILSFALFNPSKIFVQPLLNKTGLHFDSILLCNLNIIHVSSALGNISSLQSIILHSTISINTQDSFGHNCLYYAYTHENYETFDYLIYHYPFLVNQKDAFGNTIIFYMIKDGKTNFLSQCIKKAKLDVQNDIGQSPLHFATSHKRIDIMNILLSNGAPIDFTDTFYSTALHLAVEYNYEEGISTLLSYGASPNVMSTVSRTPLHLAVIRGNLKICQELCKYGANVDIMDMFQISPMIYAATSGRTSILTMFIKLGHIPHHIQLPPSIQGTIYTLQLLYITKRSKYWGKLPIDLLRLVKLLF